MAFSEVVEEFGEKILNEEGKVDRKVLGPMVFSDKVTSHTCTYVRTHTFIRTYIIMYIITYRHL